MGIMRIKARAVSEDWMVEGLEWSVRRWSLLDWAVGSQ